MNSSRNVQAKHKAGHWLDLNLALSESETEDGEQIFIGLLTANKQIAHKAGANTSVLKAGTLLQMTRQMISSMTVPGIIISESGVIQAFNREAEKLLGYTLIDVVGRNVSMLMNDDDAAKHDGYLARYMATRESAIIGAGKGRTVDRQAQVGQALQHASVHRRAGGRGGQEAVHGHAAQDQVGAGRDQGQAQEQKGGSQAKEG
jgi:PAS domain S-box-containing protein